MRKSGLVLLLLSFCPLAFGQLASNSITVNASSNATLQPDQAIFQVSVQSGLATGLDDVLTALAGSGITAANLSNVTTVQLYNSGSSTSTTALEWVFSLPVSLTNTKGTIASLTTLQQTVANLNNGQTLSFSIIGTQVSQQLAQSQTCSFSALVASASTQAQTLAAAGGLTLGSITALSGSTSNVVASPFFSTPSCTLTVTFTLSRR